MRPAASWEVMRRDLPPAPPTRRQRSSGDLPKKRNGFPCGRCPHTSKGRGCHVNSAPKLHVIVGGLPPEHEWTEAQIRRMCEPSIKALPFVKLKKDAEPQWHPESYWKVFQTRSRDQDLARGAQYALAAMAAMRADSRNVLSDIFRDMIDAGVTRELDARKTKRRPKRDLVMSGFLDQLAKMFEPRDGGEFVAEIDDAIESVESVRQCVGRLDDKEIQGLLRGHIEELKQFRTRLSAK